MPYCNNVSIAGHMGRDPELRAVSTGTQVCTFSLAISEYWRDAQGAKQERTNWVQVECWGGLAERVAKSCGKGSAVFVNGKLRENTWTTTSGERRSKLEVRAEQVFVLDARKSEGRAAPQSSDRAQAKPEPVVDESEIPF